MIRKLIPYAKGYGFKSVLAALTIIIEVLLEVYIPFVMKDVINIGIANGDISYIIQRGLLMIGLAVFSLGFGVLSARLAVVASTGFAKNLRKGLFYKVQDFSFKNVDKYSTASLITRLTTDVTNIQQAFMMSIRMLVRAPVMLVSATVMATAVSGETGVVFVFAIPALAISMGVISIMAFPRFQAMLKKYDRMNARVQENLTSMRVVKAFVRENYESSEFYTSATEVTKAQVRAEKLLVLNSPIAQMVLYICMIATCWIGGNAIIAGTMQTGDLMSFISYISQILSSIMMITMVFVNLVMSKASANRILEVIGEPIDITDDESDKSLKVPDGSIEFRNVSFSYSGDKDTSTLIDINLKIQAGETVGIIGGTGSSKTTLVQLIPRLYDADSGSVIVGGHDVREYSIESLRKAVSMVLQKNVLFTGTIKENLLWGDQSATDEEIIEACRSAQAEEFIENMPDKYDTELGQGGVNVSGGQKQRLCIARALLKHPKIIILDDSTSAVDTATDAKIRSAFRERLSNTTTIIIAQRITSVMDSDKIIVMHEGRINAVGTHDELMRSNEIYREVYNSQQKGVA